MTAFSPSAILEQFAANVGLMTSENANRGGGGLKESTYRVTPEEEPDSAVEGLFYVDFDSVGPRGASYGTGHNTRTGVVTVQVGYFRGGGNAGGGDRLSVAKKANDDLVRLGDICENPDHYNRDVTGIRTVSCMGHRRTIDGKRVEIYEVTFAISFESAVATS